MNRRGVVGWATIGPSRGAPPKPLSGRGPDRGGASLWLLATGFVLVFAGVVGATVGAAIVARHRAQMAADLGALAGAVRAADGGAVACAAANRVVEANGARMVACRLDGLDVGLQVEMPMTGVVGESRTAVAVARAGPIRVPGVPGALGLPGAPGAPGKSGLLGEPGAPGGPG